MKDPNDPFPSTMDEDDEKIRKENHSLRTYYVHGYNDDCGARVWVADQNLTAIKAHELAEELRQRFPADRYTVKLQTQPDMCAVMPSKENF